MSTNPLIVAACAAAAFAAGAALGWIFYAGLYRTVQELGRSHRPTLLLGASLLLRMSMLLAGFWLLMMAGDRWCAGGWLALLSGLLGVTAMRALLMRRYRRPETGLGRQRADDDAKRQPR